MNISLVIPGRLLVSVGGDQMHNPGEAKGAVISDHAGEDDGKLLELPSAIYSSLQPGAKEIVWSS